MPRNLVLCADGTCNAFGRSSSNVARMLEYIELQAATTQVACYDQGIGTRRGEYTRIRAFRDALGDSGALLPLDPPDDSWMRPWTWPSLIRSMTHGQGLDTNVGQLYAALAALFKPDDQVFLFGFSRGAFTVRALAGLVWRYGLPATGEADDANARFAEAWPLFETEFPDEHGNNAARALQFRTAHGQRACNIRFLGLWDTVKSYGGLRPVMLPHLRHNPAVRIVRHALSLDERRGWFEPTTWGWLDSDQQAGAAASRLDAGDIERIRKQDVVEVWFTGCHADVGGGGRNDRTSSIALRWMLGEAHCAGLRLNAAGDRFLAGSVQEDGEPRTKKSRTVSWRIVECKKREAITNAGRWPARKPAPRGAAPRRPLDSVRGNTLWYHESTTDLSRFGTIPEGVTLKPRPTLRTTAPAR